jgi:nucleotide-binding universal stress UspA family protein
MEAKTDMDKVLVATKRSPTSAIALAQALELASAHSAELLIVHVVPTLDVGFLDDGETAIVHEPTDVDRAVLSDAAATAAARGVRSSTLLLRGSIAEQIVNASELHDVDLIVIGTRGHNPIASAILGNVALRVVRKSSRPVLVARVRSGAPVGGLSSSPAHRRRERVSS